MMSFLFKGRQWGYSSEGRACPSGTELWPGTISSTTETGYRGAHLSPALVSTNRRIRNSRSVSARQPELDETLSKKNFKGNNIKDTG